MTPQERLRKHQRALEKTQRELDRERVKLENQEKKLVQDIKKSAKNGQMGACKIQAKDLVRTRRFRASQDILSTHIARHVYSEFLLTFLNSQIHRQILCHAHSTSGHLSPNPDCQI